VSADGSYRCLLRHDCLNPGSLFDMLMPYIAFNAAYNSGERESEHASTCLENTRKDVINNISVWVEGNHNQPVCWAGWLWKVDDSPHHHRAVRQQAAACLHLFFLERKARSKRYFQVFPHIRTSARLVHTGDPNANAMCSRS